MARKLLRYRLEAVTLKVALALFRPLGLDRASAFGGWIGRTFGPKLGITRRARRRVARAMPELSEAEIERIMAAMWDNLGRTAFEYAHLDVFTRTQERHRIEIIGIEEARADAEAGKGGFLVSGHFGNWELMPLIMRFHGLEGGEIYRAANNPFVNEWMVAMREQLIAREQIPKGPKGARALLKVIRSGKFIAMLIDQKLNDGVEARLFGIPSMTASTPAALAMRQDDVGIYPVCIERKTVEGKMGAYFRITVYPKIEFDRTREGEEMRVTQVLNDFLEARIRERPENWFWLHNRW